MAKRKKPPMSKYRVAVNGLNCQVDVNGHLLRMGFYTARFVEAPDAVEAAERAVQMIRDFDEFKTIVRIEDRVPPVVVDVEIEEFETFDDIDPLEPALAFYFDQAKPRKPWWKLW